LREKGRRRQGDAATIKVPRAEAGNDRADVDDQQEAPDRLSLSVVRDNEVSWALS